MSGEEDLGSPLGTEMNRTVNILEDSQDTGRDGLNTSEVVEINSSPSEPIPNMSGTCDETAQRLSRLEAMIEKMSVVVTEGFREVNRRADRTEQQMQDLRKAFKDSQKEQAANWAKWEKKLDSRLERCQEEVRAMCLQHIEHQNEDVAAILKQSEIATQDRIYNLRNEVGASVSNIKQDLKTLEEGQGSVRAEIQALQGRPGRNSFQVKHKPPTFEGLARERPMKYLRELKQYCKAASLNQTEILHVINQSLSGTANDWWHLVSGGINELEAFEKAFVSRYWNDDVQRRAKRNLETGKHYVGGLTRTDYAIQKFGTARDFRPQMTDSEIVDSLSWHFGDDVQAAIRTRGIEDLTGLLMLLEKFDQTELANKRTDSRNGQTNHTNRRDDNRNDNTTTQNPRPSGNNNWRNNNSGNQNNRNSGTTDRNRSQTDPQVNAVQVTRTNDEPNATQPQNTQQAGAQGPWSSGNL